jgi:hypothetical protein
MSTDNQNPFDGFNVIFSYSRAQAIADGVLVELKEAAAQGFKVHTVCTEAVWRSVIEWPQTGNRETAQYLREVALLRAAFLAAKAKMAMEKAGVPDPQPERLDFHVRAVVFGDGQAETKDVQLYMLIGPGDTLDPVGTIMLPGED